jgi:hypothetical protein
MRLSVVRKVLLSAPVLAAYVLASFLTGCSSSNNNNNNQNHSPAAITASAGASQSAPVGTAFGTALAATVTDSGGSPVSGASVTFTAPSSGASGTFATSGSATETDTTNSSGVATASTFTANSTAGGPYTVTAAVSGVSTPASFSLTNSTAAPTSTTYIFSASGTEVANATNGGAAYYAVVGAVALDSSGNVTGGEEDYNDGTGVNVPGASITSGSLTVNASGQGTLTLVTNSAMVGGGINPITGATNPAGTEIFGVQFANVDHAAIMQFDGSATSSGSFDLQTTPPPNTANYAFVLSGVDYNYNPVGYGGVLVVNSNAMSGIADLNYFNSTSSSFAVAPGNVITGASVGAPDSSGRGQINGLSINGTTLALTYYAVGPETVRLIDMDPGSTAGAGSAMIGSAYGQGSTTFTDSSLTGSVIGFQGGAWAENLYAVAGSLGFTPPASGATNGTVAGIVDDFEVNTSSSSPDTTVSGTYTMSNVVSGTTYNGYGALTFTKGTPSALYQVKNLGIYMTDPALNLLDPNNTTSGMGGALVLDLDTFLTGGTGVLVSQTDTTSANFNGPYTVAAQESFSAGGFFWEYDYLGQGAVSSLAFSGTGDVSDPFAYFGSNPALYSAVPMTGTAAPDANETTNGRYTMVPFDVAAATSSSFDNLSLAIYQADGGTLLFMENSGSDGLGYFEQQGSLTGLPAKRGPVKKAERLLKPRSKALRSRGQK